LIIRTLLDPPSVNKRVYDPAHGGTADTFVACQGVKPILPELRYGCDCGKLLTGRPRSLFDLPHHPIQPRQDLVQRLCSKELGGLGLNH